MPNVRTLTGYEKKNKYSLNKTPLWFGQHEKIVCGKQEKKHV